MFIKSLVLNNFRNYSYQKIEFDRAINIIYGKNAQGKTNILESIFLCSSARSHRTNRDLDIIKTGEDGYNIYLEGERDNIPFSINFASKSISNRNSKRIIKVNDMSIARTGELMGVLNCVMFSPEDLSLIKDGPSERRRFIDILISQINPSYFYNLQEYNKVIKQKNALLKYNQNTKINDLLDIYNEKQAEVGIKIIKERYDFIQTLLLHAKENHYQISKNTETLNLSYVSDIDISDLNKQHYYSLLEKNKEKEIKNGSSMLGPHRDDIDITLNDMSVKEFGSQGQQRSVVLSLKFSEIEVIKEKTSKNPILLLDDALSELDILRKRNLMEKINNNQTFITCTEKRRFMSIKNTISFYNVQSGVVNKI